MEGREGMVAVIQGLENAGLAVTLLNRCKNLARSNSSQLLALNQIPKLLKYSNSIRSREHKNSQTYAKSSFKHGQTQASGMDKASRSSQICDGRYASTYQLAHCNMVPTSPPVLGSEFPLQRCEPCRTQGNFEVGETIVERNRSRSPSPSYVYNSREGLQWSGRASLSPARPSRELEAFATSLRKYPSPERAYSVELMQRLISYTQASNFSKSSYHTKSTRNISKGLETDASHPKTDKSRNLEPTRIRREPPTRDSGPDTDVRYNIKQKTAFPQNTGISRRIRDERLNDMYNYLNNSARGRTEGRQTRNPRQARKCLRDIYGDKGLAMYPVCPNILNRYKQHRRSHHGAKENENENDTICPGTSLLPPCIPSNVQCQAPRRSICPRIKICCTCKKPIPCPCKRRSGSLSPDQEENISSIKDIILSWLNEIPVYANESSADKAHRDSMVKRLIEDLQKLDKAEFVNKLDDEIIKFIDKMPMWIPGDKTEQDAFRKQMASSLLNKLKDLRDRNKLINANDTEGLEGMEDVIRNIVSLWLEKANLNRDGDESNNKILIDELALKLKDILARNGTKDNINKELQQEIRNYLRKFVDIAGFHMDSKTQDNLVNDLLTRIRDLSKNMPIQTPNDIDELIAQIWESLEMLSIKLDRNDPVAKTAVKNLAAKLQDPVKDNVVNVEKKRRDDISRWLQDVTQKTGVPIEDRTQNEFVKKIMTKVQNVPRKEYRYSDDSLKNSFNRKISFSDENDQSANFGSKYKSPALIYSTRGETEGSNKLKLDPELKALLKEDISDVLDKSPVNFNNREHIEADLTDILADLVMRGTDEDVVKEQIRDVLKTASVPSIPAEDICNELLIHANELTPSYRTDYSTSHRDETGRNKADISGINMLNKRPQKNVPSATSTPKKPQNQINRSKLNFNGSSISDLDDINDSSFDLQENRRRAKEEEKYSHKVKDKIKTWIDELPVQLNDIDENLEESVIKELADDIIDRQKYFQVNPDAKSSSKEELEHLKYQAYKMLGKVLDGNTLTPVMTKVDDLMNEIKNIPVPILAKSSEKKRGFQQEKEISSTEDTIPPDFVNNLESVILDWLKDKAIYKKMAAKDKQKQENLVPELAKTLTDILTNSKAVPTGENMNEILLQKITDHFKRFPLDPKQKNNQQFLQSTALDLLNRLKELQLIKDNKSGKQTVRDNLEDSILDWLTYMPMYEDMTPNDRKMQEKLTPQLAKNLASIIKKNKGISSEPDQAHDEITIQEVMNQLKKFLINTKLKNDDEFLRNTATDLLNNFKQVRLIQDTNEFVKENLEGAIFDWLKGKPLYQKRSAKDKQVQERLVLDLATALTEIFENLKTTSAVEDTDEIIIREIMKYLEKFPLDPKQRNDRSFLRSTAEELLRYLKELQLFQDISDRDNVRTSLTEYQEPASSQSKVISRKIADEPRVFKSIANTLHDTLKAWCDNIPIQADAEEAAQMKENLANKLMFKIGELNMSPEILNDDFIYEDMLQDFVDEQFNTPLIDITEAEKKALMASLMDKIKSIRQKYRDDLAVHAYKQQLRDTISNVLPHNENETLEEQQSFQNLKDNLADAFINLHSVPDDGNLKKKYTNKIKDEIEKFCNDYLKRYPSTPIDSNKLNQDLYKALKKVPVPTNESMKSEVDELRMKDKIIEFFDNLPIQQLTKSDQIQRNKILSAMGKRLHDIQKENELNPDNKYQDTMKAEILKYLKKLPMEGDEKELERIAGNLIETLEKPEHSRSFASRLSGTSAGSTKRESVQDATNCECKRNILDRLIEKLDTCSFPTPAPSFPPCTLSTADRAHLQRIRERNQACPLLTPRRKLYCRDAAISPPPLDNGSQTDMQPCSCPNHDYRVQQIPCPPPRKICPSKLLQTDCPSFVKCTPSPQVSASSQAEIVPYVVVKEYFWDSQNSPNPTGVQCQLPFIAPCEHPSPCSMSGSHMRPCLRACNPTVSTGCAILRPQPRSPEISSYLTPGPSDTSSQKPRVTQLGSFDNNLPQQTQSPARKQWQQRDDVENKEEFLGSQPPPIDLRVSEEELEESFICERPRKEETGKCKCHDRAMTKCRNWRPVHYRPSCQTSHLTKQCAKCCGAPCPHPTGLFFR